MDKFFEISKRSSNVKTEIIAGLTTFFAMAYIIVLTPNQLIGFSNKSELAGASQLWNAVYIASIIAAVLGTLYYAFYAKMPFAQACGIGLNSFFFASFVAPQIACGGNIIEGYQAGLVIIFISGIIFLVLSLTGARTYIAKAMPDCIKKAIPAGIGLFIAFIGLQNREVGIIQDSPDTLVQFIRFNDASWREIAPALVALIGFIIMAILAKLNVKGYMLICIVSTTIIYYVATWQLPSFEATSVTQPFKDFADIGITGIFTADSWKNAFSGKMLGGTFSVIMLIITFSLVNMFDTIGTLYGTAAEANMVDENGDPIAINKSMTCDSMATVTGAVCGTSTVTTFVESALGVAAGGRTGLASVVTSLCFALCLFSSPVASVIPAAATAPALIYVGVLTMKNFATVDMKDMRSAVPAFLTLIMMPLTYSIANGIGIGAIAYVLITIFTGNFRKRDIAVTIVAALFVCKFLFSTM